MKEYEEQTLRAAEQKRTIERKFEDKIRRAKESEMAAKKQVSELERDLATVEERLANEQTLNQSQLEKLAAEVTQMREQ
jgi:hypothetical protein